MSGFVGGTLDKPAPISDEEAAYITDQSEDGIRKQRTRSFVAVEVTHSIPITCR